MCIAKRKLLTCVCVSALIISVAAQSVRVIDKKGTITEVDPSKWRQEYNDIYNKNSGNVGIGINSPQAKLHNAGSTIFGAMPNFLGNFVVNGLIGAADVTVDKYSGAVIKQTTAGVSLSLPSPTNVTPGRIFQVANSSISPQSITVGNTTIAPGAYALFYWDGGVWSMLTGSSVNEWHLTGNTGTTPGTGVGQNYLGTVDNEDLSFATHGAEKIRLFSIVNPVLGLGEASLTGIAGGVSTWSGPTLFLGSGGNLASRTGLDIIIDADNNSSNSVFRVRANGDSGVDTLNLVSVFESGNVGIGIKGATPGNRLHVKAVSNPLRLEGLQVGSNTDQLLSVDALGVVRQQTTISVLTGLTTNTLSSGSNTIISNVNGVSANLTPVAGAVNSILGFDASGNLVKQATAPNSSFWLTNGNSGLSSSTNFIGTIDNEDVVFKRFSTQAGLLGSTNTAWGLSTFGVSVTGTYNTALGYFAGNTVMQNGGKNTAVGALANVGTTGSNNIAIGYNANVPAAIANNQMSIGNTIYGLNMGQSGTGLTPPQIGIATTTPTFTTPSNTGATIPTLGVDGTVNATNYTSPIKDFGTTSSIAWNLSEGASARVTLSATSPTLALSNLKTGMYGTLIITNNATIAQSIISFETSTTVTAVSIPATCNKVVNGGGNRISLTATAGAVDLANFFFDGTYLYWTINKNYN